MKLSKQMTDELCEAIYQRKVSKSELAKLLGVSRSLIYKWLDGNGTMKISDYENICNLLSIKVNIKLK